MTIWHYAVWKWSVPYVMEPACVSDRRELFPVPGKHGLTIVRGHVNCPNCKRMMGMV